MGPGFQESDWDQDFVKLVADTTMHARGTAEKPAKGGDRGERPAGRAQLLAKRGHTGRVQNPAKVSENRPACGTAQHTLAVCFVFEKLEKF